MSKSKNRSALSRVVNRFLDHKRTLGQRYLLQAWVLQKLQRHVEQSDCRDLNAKCFESWLASLKDNHANTRRKWYQIVRHFCVYRRRIEPGCFLPSVEGAAKRQPYVTPVILEPRSNRPHARSGIQTSKNNRLTTQSASITPRHRVALHLRFALGGTAAFDDERY